MLTKEAIAQADDRPTVDLEVPEWGGAVRLKAMTGKERSAFLSRHIKNPGKGQAFVIEDIQAHLAALSIVDESGARMFSEAEVEVLAGKSGVALERVFKAASKLNALTEEDVDEIAGDFRGAQTSASGSA